MENTENTEVLESTDVAEVAEVAERKDGRVSPPILFKKRKQIIKLYKRGLNVMSIVKATGLCWRAVRVAIDAYERNGIDGLRPGKRGRRLGAFRTLSSDQERQIQQDIRTSRPEQLGLDVALWTRESVRAYMKKNFDVNMPSRTVGEYLNRWGFPPQKPVWATADERSEAVKAWMKTGYLELLQRAKHEHAEIHWANDVAVANAHTPADREPETNAAQGARKRFSMISSVSNQGKCYWMVIEGGFSAGTFIEFLTSVAKVASRKVFVVIDNLKVNYGKTILDWLKEHKDDVELVNLPNGDAETAQEPQGEQKPQE